MEGRAYAKREAEYWGRNTSVICQLETRVIVRVLMITAHED